MCKEFKPKAEELSDEEAAKAAGAGEIKFSEVRVCNDCYTILSNIDKICPNCRGMNWHYNTISGQNNVSHHGGPH